MAKVHKVSNERILANVANARKKVSKEQALANIQRETSEERILEEESCKRKDQELQKRMSDNMYYVGLALKNLGEAVSIQQNRQESGARMATAISSANNNLTEFLNNINTIPPLTEREANISASLHTFMRKGMDDPLSIILYHMIAQGRGVSMWHTFVKNVTGKNGNLDFHRGERAMEQEDTLGFFDNIVMRQCIHAFKDGFNDAKACGYLNLEKGV